VSTREEIGWDDERTARAYEAFASRHSRYDDANRELVTHAAIEAGARLLDLAAGTGRTTSCLLEHLGDGAGVSIVCVEPSAAMRALGERRVQDTRVSWVSSLDEVTGTFDRVLCGAAMWILRPLEETFPDLARRLAPGALLVFDVPALYVCEADEPGGGDDPLLLRLPSIIAAGQVPRADPVEPLQVEGIEAALARAGMTVERWRFRVALSQAAQRDWMKIPVITNALLADLDIAERDARIDAAFATCDPSSWRWERWIGWTARRS
jgi:SAM-dependent methyltransferase